MLLFQRTGAREAVRFELESLKIHRDPYSQAMAKRWETRLLALEVSQFVVPVTRISDVVDGFEEAGHLFHAAGYPEEARYELLRAAEYAGKQPIRNAIRAEAILQKARADAAADKDLPLVARASLALAELSFDETMSGTGEPDEAAIRLSLTAFDRAMEDYDLAGMALGSAEVKAAVGRKLMAYGFPIGADNLREAAQLWDDAEHHGAADGAWRDLYMWHCHRADREQVDALEEKLCARPAIESRLTDTTLSVQLAQAALAKGNFAEAVEISVAVQKEGLEPGPAAALLLMESSALNGQGHRAEAERTAGKAVALLRPARPCALLGDALFLLGSVQRARDEMFRLWEEAAQMDLSCGANLSAAQRYANMAEFLSQSGEASTLPDGRTVEGLFQRAMDLAGGGRDIESAVLRGNISQRRGVVAFRVRDWTACDEHLSEAEVCFRSVGRNADLAFTLSHRGLVLLQAARDSRSREVYEIAHQKFDEASRLFQRQDLIGERFRVERYASTVSWEAGNLASSPAREAFYEEAKRQMVEAGSLMELLRRGRQEQNPFLRQSSLDDIGALMEPFLEEAFRFHLNALQCPADALTWLEKGKARGLLDALADNPPPPPQGLDSLILEEERKLESDRSAILRNSYSARRRWKELSVQLEQLWVKMSEQPISAAYGALRLGLPVDWPRWQHALREQSKLPLAAGRAVLSVHFAWPYKKTDPIQLIACRSDWDAPKTAVTTTPCGNVESFLQQCFDGIGRSSLTSWLKMVGGDDAWCRRFSPLIAPLRDWAAPGDIVLLIPQGPLHSAPLHALFLDDKPLSERNAVCSAPSAAALMVCWQRQQSVVSKAKSAVIGCPNPGFGFPALPRAKEEAEYVAKLLGVEPLMGDNIDPESFRHAIRDAGTVHFAGHATEAKSGWESGLQLGGGHSFTARDFFQTPLNVNIFTLSGCRTARSRRREGDEMLGLIPALLYAGVSSVLASQWEASDHATATIMRHFYSFLHGERPGSKADTLRAAITLTRAEFPTLPLWAAFTLHDDWK